MNTNPIQRGPEISKLVHAARHEKEDHAVYQEKKRKKKDDKEKTNPHPEGDVEDLMDHSHEEACESDELTTLPESDGQRDDEINLDVLI